VWLPPSPGSTAWRAQLNDPRWAGGPVSFFSFQRGGSFTDQYDAQYRAVYAGNNLYVTIQVLTDPDGADLSDAVYFGITEGTGGSGAHLFEIPPEPSTTAPVTDPSGTVPHDAVFPRANTTGLINYYMTLDRSVAAPSWSAAAAPPPWLKNVATWLSSPGVNWAITLQIDTSARAITGPVQLFFGTRISMPASTTVVLTTSSQADATHPAIGDTPAKTVITDWANFDALGNACPAGITISSNSIGVLSGGSLTNAVNTCPGSTCTNQFRVEAQNVPASISSTPFAIRTRLRVADWGATIADPNAPWEDFGIPANVFTEPSSAFTNPPWIWTPSGTVVDMDYTCSLVGGHTYCPWLTNAVASGQQHQCMLAEISLAPGVTGGTIQTPAVYRNMEFGTLSALHQEAKITLKGLQKALGVAGDRDVYLYVQTKNLPAQSRSPMELPERELVAARGYATHPPAVPARSIGRGQQPPPATTNLPLLTGDQALGEVYPTYRVLAYYDSGRTIKVRGKLHKVLTPMVPFGFYLDHKGTFYGFSHSLEFLGANAREIAPNFYVVHVASEGDVRVRTNISAEEQPIGAPPPPPPPPPHTVRCSCNLAESRGWSPLAVGLAGLVATGLALRLRRRGRQRGRRDGR